MVTSRWLTMVSSTTFAARAKASFVAAASPTATSKARLPGRSGQTCGASFFRAASAPVTCGSGCQSTAIASAASFAAASVSATTKATESPT